MNSITETNDANQFSQLRHTWNSLLDRCRDKNVFLTWDFLSLYWKHFGKGKKLRILTVGNDEEVIAIAPLRQTHFNPWGPLGYDVIEPLAYTGADYTGLILPEKETEYFSSFLNYLIGSRDWDFIHLFDVPGESAIPKLLPHVHNPVLSSSFEMVKTSICPYIPVPDSVDLLMNTINGNLRKNIRRCKRNLQRDYGRVELRAFSEFGSINKAMGIFFRLHQERWGSKDMPGAYYKQEKRDLHVELAERFADNGWLALYFLTVNDEPIGASYNFVYDRKMYNVASGFGPEYSKYSIGSLMVAKVLEKCVQEGIKEYDFMKGHEPYKFRWAKTFRTNVDVRFVNERFTSNLYNCGIRVARRIGISRMMKKFLHFSRSAREYLGTKDFSL